MLVRGAEKSMPWILVLLALTSDAQGNVNQAGMDIIRVETLYRYKQTYKALKDILIIS